MSSIPERLNRVREHIAAAAERRGRRPDDVILIGASKTMPASMMDEALAAGLEHIGENRLQEAKAKFPQLTRPAVKHFIGHLQSNKAGQAVELFDVIQSVDRPSLIAALERRAGMTGSTVECLVEVNVGGELNKSGVSPERLPELLQTIADCAHLRVTGLMSIPPLADDPEESRGYFRRLRELAESFRRPADNIELRHLSMGMTADYPIAIEEGATMVRVGTGIFGPRSAPH